MKLFHRIYFHTKDMFWLQFLQIPKSKTIDDFQIEGYSSEQLARFWKRSSSLQNFLLKSLAIGGASTMVLVWLAYLVPHLRFQAELTPLVFWSVVGGNFIFLILLGSANLATVMGAQIYFYLICRLLIERFDLAAAQLKRLASAKKLEVLEIERTAAIFERIVNDLQRCDHFLSKLNLLNYYFGVSICALTLVNGLFLSFKNLFSRIPTHSLPSCSSFRQKRFYLALLFTAVCHVIYTGVDGHFLLCWKTTQRNHPIPPAADASSRLERTQIQNGHSTAPNSRLHE